jgi:hypothetical protein
LLDFRVFFELFSSFFSCAACSIDSEVFGLGFVGGNHG